MGGFFLFLICLSPAAEAQQRVDALQEYRSGNFEDAVRICKAEIAANPNNLESHVVLCWSLVALGRYEEGRSYALAGRNISRYDPRIIEILGEVYYFQGRNTEALQYFQEYVNLAPQGTRVNTVYYYIGEVFIRRGQFRRADIALSTAVYYVPENAEWWVRLAYARENAGEIQGAISAYERALTLDSRMADARRGLERTRASLNGP
ncbi:MAG: tetratricopeptide repeat protein [Spirochaetaceae bacterium]|jgi:tetratricopeptide (TPR) repeat protein|nr:tetratricopeptide repeat protein [Spirochaetaceae bacterium]